MIQRAGKSFFYILILIFSHTSFALPEDRQQVIYLRADSADISQENHKGIYTGRVELDQGSTHLRAARAVTEGNAENKLIKAIAEGNQAEQAHYWSLTEKNKEPLHAYADTIFYYPEQHIIELVGNAKITQGKNLFTAPKIIYDTERQHVLTKNTEKQRTVITIYPEKKHE